MFYDSGPLEPGLISGSMPSNVYRHRRIGNFRIVELLTIFLQFLDQGLDCLLTPLLFLFRLKITLPPPEEPFH